MKYNQEIILKNRTRACLRNGDASDGPAVYENFNLTHAETDFLLFYPDENSFDPEQEAQFLQEKTESPNEIEIIALVDGKVAGTAGIEAIGHKHKVRHRAEFGISVLRAYWGLGLGKALSECLLGEMCSRQAVSMGALIRKGKVTGSYFSRLIEKEYTYALYEKALA